MIALMLIERNNVYKVFTVDRSPRLDASKKGSLIS